MLVNSCLVLRQSLLDPKINVVCVTFKSSMIGPKTYSCFAEKNIYCHSSSHLSVRTTLGRLQRESSGS